MCDMMVYDMVMYEINDMIFYDLICYFIIIWHRSVIVVSFFAKEDDVAVYFVFVVVEDVVVAVFFQWHS